MEAKINPELLQEYVSKYKKLIEDNPDSSEIYLEFLIKFVFQDGYDQAENKYQNILEKIKKEID